MARVAMLLFESVIKFSKSRLQAVTAEGCFIATLWKGKKSIKQIVINKEQNLKKQRMRETEILI